MKTFLLLAVGIGLLAAWPETVAQEPKSLEPSPPAVKSALTEVISHQLDAFRAGDFSKAYSFASSGIQKMFPPAVFENMVKTNYPMMTQSTSVDFGAALDNGEDGVVFVRLTGAGGIARVFRYALTLEAGTWKITGVEETDNDGATGREPITA